MTCFTPQQVQFTLLDIHRGSLDAARHIIDTLGLSNFVRDYVNDDATRYRSPDTPHIILTETMQRALSVEPQVAVTLNLAPQLREGGYWLPHEITLSLRMADLGREFTQYTPDGRILVEAQRDHRSIGEIFRLDAQTVSTRDKQSDLLPAAHLTLPDDLPTHYQPIIVTQITIFNDVRLDLYDSGITIPRILPYQTEFAFRYQLGSVPGLIY
jgi:hypothetical protein